MSICDKLLHPFQKDPGTSQQQRIAASLVLDAPPIDGRKMADLLNYFVELSRHIKYYDATLNSSDWQPFFKKSIPFLLAAIIKYDSKAVSKKFKLYNKLFDKHPSKQSLQLLLNFTFYYTINRINNWHLQLKNSGLPVTMVLEQLIKDKLSSPLKKYISHSNTAVKYYGVKRISFSKLLANEVWNLTEQDLQQADDNFILKGKTKRSRLIVLRNELNEILPSFLQVIKITGTAAEGNMEQSLFPLKEELQQLHAPHLGLLFAFLKLFQHLQTDLNSYTKKHLDFFYKEVLQLKPREATPDKAHIIFEIQNHLDKYLLKKGLLVKDGKDSNKAEVAFALEDEIVVNKAMVADVKTLFLNQHTAYDTRYIEGVYIAPNALKADGIKIDFKEGDPKNWPTVGNKFSKYIDPEQKSIKAYPNARMGFILSSPVLLLNEGHRTIDITLACQLKNSCDNLPKTVGKIDNCCEELIDANTPTVPTAAINCNKEETKLLEAQKLYTQVQQIVKEVFYYISKDLIAAAIKKGMGNAVIEKLTNFLKADNKKLCYCPTEKLGYDTVIIKSDFESIFTLTELTIVKEIFKPQHPLTILFSGEKAWIAPSELLPPEDTLFDAITFGTLNVDGSFTIKIKAVLKADKPAVTFYNKEKLKEDFNTEQPLVKIELNDFVKKFFSDQDFKALINHTEAGVDCCLYNKNNGIAHFISLYHFFRDVTLAETVTNKTDIKVTVCGLKNFIVQNDESLMDVNAPIYPFGTRPEIKDFNILNPPIPAGAKLIGPSFYIGSKEMLCKKWDSIRINLNWKDKPADFKKYYIGYLIDGLDKDNFKINLSVLQDGKWQDEAIKRKLFDDTPSLVFQDSFNQKLCDHKDIYEQGIIFKKEDFINQSLQPFKIDALDFKGYKTDSRNGFLKITLRDQDFLHKDYAFVLARQMMALGKFPDKGVEGAIYLGSGNSVIVFKDTGNIIVQLKTLIVETAQKAGFTKSDAEAIVAALPGVRNAGSDEGISISNAEFLNQLKNSIDNVNAHANQTKNLADSVNILLTTLQTLFSIFKPDGKLVDDLSVPIPNEPWTPIIKNIALDYTAKADIKDIDLIHLYPYEGTFKQEEIELQPTLFPTFCDEGNLFIGLQKLMPGSNVNILFQLAEATADSEEEREEISWYYLQNNNWKSLRKGFEVLLDDTNGLTTSGIVKFALPANISNDNTILPKGLHWIKAAINKNSKSVSEIIGIHTQAIKVLFTNDAINDKMRLAAPLPAQSIAKLKEADTAVKKVNQPYDSFGGRIPALEGQFYVSVSELLRHKNRAIQKFDYERMALEAFPELFKVKCINHSYGLNAHKFNSDFVVAPGYVLLAVLPDLNKLKAGQSYQPRVPVSTVEKIADYISKHTSPFVRLKVMNPRYEKINFCLKVKLYVGKDEVFYKEKLQEDIRNSLAPWAIGQYDKLSFGQCVNRSDMVGFLETRDYIDYLLDLRMAHEFAGAPPSENAVEICPQTPRSILIAGAIDICIQQNDCENWDDKQLPCGDEAQKLVNYCK